MPWLHKALERVSGACQLKAEEEKDKHRDTERAVKAKVTRLQGLVQSFLDSLFIRGQFAMVSSSTFLTFCEKAHSNLESLSPTSFSCTTFLHGGDCSTASLITL